MYKIYGYDDICNDFEYTLDSFVKACQLFLKLDYGLNVVFIDGISYKSEQKLKIDLWGKTLKEN